MLQVFKEPQDLPEPLELKVQQDCKVELVPQDRPEQPAALAQLVQVQQVPPVCKATAAHPVLLVQAPQVLQVLLVQLVSEVQPALPDHLEQLGPLDHKVILAAQQVPLVLPEQPDLVQLVQLDLLVPPACKAYLEHPAVLLALLDPPGLLAQLAHKESV